MTFYSRHNGIGSIEIKGTSSSEFQSSSLSTYYTKLNKLLVDKANIILPRNPETLIWISKPQAF